MGNNSINLFKIVQGMFDIIIMGKVFEL